MTFDQLRAKLALARADDGARPGLPKAHAGLLWQVLALVLPVTATYTLEGCGNLIPLIAASNFVGSSEGDVAARVGAVGLGETVVTCVGFVIRAGWTGGQDALVPQAFGKGDFNQARAHLHQCQIWMTLLFVACAALLYQTEGILTALGVADEKMAKLASDFVVLNIPGLWFDFQYDTLRKFLLNQKMPTPSLIVMCAVVPCHLFWSWVLLQYGPLSAMHSIGAAWTIKCATAFALLGVYATWYAPCPSCRGWWWPWRFPAISPRGLAEYARFGLPSTGMYGLDWWAWEALTLLAGGLRDGPELAAHVAAAGASDWLFMVMKGSPKAATVLIGAAAGQGDTAGVRAVFRTCACCCMVLCAAVALAIWSFRHQLVTWLLPGEGPAQASLAGLLPLIMLQLAIDAATSLCHGTLAGLGEQGRVCLGCLLCSWVVQLPLAWGMAYPLGLGVLGLRSAGCVAGTLNLTYGALLLRSCIRRHAKEQSLDFCVTDYAGPPCSSGAKGEKGHCE